MKMKTNIKKVIALVMIMALAIPFSGSAINNYKQAKQQAVTQATAVSASSENAETTTSTTTTTSAVTAAAKSASSNSKKKTTTVADETTIAEVANKTSKIVNGAKYSKSYTASSNGMSVYAEKIKLTLPVYENGKKTSKTVNRFAYIAVIQGNPSKFKSIAASQSTGKTVDTVTNAARAVNATFAVNGEMCNHNTTTYDGFLNAATDQPTATVIKNSKIAQSNQVTPSLTMTKDGVWEYPVNVGKDNAQSLIDSGVITSIGYTYPVIWRGEKFYIENGAAIAPMWFEFGLLTSNKKNKYYNDHVLVGQIDAQTYVVGVSESFGRGYLCEIFENMGVQNAYWGNGGHCATMYIKGYGVVNRPNDTKLCGAADIMYF